MSCLSPQRSDADSPLLPFSDSTALWLCFYWVIIWNFKKEMPAGYSDATWRIIIPGCVVMLSIIICSVSPLRLLDVKQNIKETIWNEVLYEIIAVDNREKKWPIAKAYNWGAQAAQYPFLFCVHEDIKFHSTGWGTFIEQKLAEPDCGVFGFAVS